jgi:hypothetical protein
MSKYRFNIKEENGKTLVFVGEVALIKQSAFAYVDVTDISNFKVQFSFAVGSTISIPIKSLTTDPATMLEPAIFKVVHLYKSNLAHLKSKGVELNVHEKAFVADYDVSQAYQKQVRRMLLAP